ncbi:hypothetical protein PR003_g18168 [Phytophthora rubi]|uniref:Uncharacterized protein n=2 Tax=Phytophthora rubi TaxID=129364 RepID=A0A6A3KFT5_9STRA|nr:hypothetical protein PR001_g17453 [Phytophthora rubi]KAE9318729.1 hypothetical protein PR003_g18168 [Phytophthora rubi]
MADSPATPPPPASSSGDGAGDTGQQGTPAAPASSVSRSDTPTSTGPGVSAPSQASPTRVDTPASSIGLPAATSTPLAVLGAAQVSVGVTSTTQQPVTVTGLPTSMTLSADALQAASTLVRQLQMVPSGGNVRQDSSFLRPATSATNQATPTSSTTSTTMVPATMRDLHRGSTFAGTSDGLARVIPLPRLSDAELRRLSSLVGGDATTEVLQSGSHRLVDPTDFRVRVAMEREALALAQVYGVDELALRAMNTVRYLQTSVQRVLTLEQGSSAQNDSAQVAQLRAECAQLVANLASQKAEYETNVAALEAAHAEAMLNTPAPTPTPVPNFPPPGKLQDEIDALRAAAGRLSCEKSDLQDQILASTREVKRLQEFQDLRDKRIAELETELAGVQKFSAAALMDFLSGNTNLSGHWKRLLELLRHYQEGRTVPSQFRTRLQISARDEDSDDCGPYVLQGSKAATPSPHSTSGGSIKSSTSRTPLASPSGQASKSAVTGKSGRKTPRLPLSGTPSPKGTKSTHLSASSGSGSGDQTIDLTHSSASTPSSTRVMLYVDRLKLAQRPKKFRPDKARALKNSPSRVSEGKAMSAVPHQFLWDDVRADVRELMLNGVQFWDAVAEARKNQMLHDQFGKTALIEILVSAIYWEALDRTPWTSFVSDRYFEAALKEVLDPVFDRPSSSEEEEDDPRVDRTFHSKAAARSGSIPTRGQQSSSSGKRPRGSSTSSGAAKTSKLSAQTSAGQTARAKSNIPDPAEDDGAIERPRKGSWFHYGIRVQELPRQTVGFPRYMPVKAMMKHLHLRWRAPEYWRLLQTTPWDDMWKNRVQTLVFFQYDDLSSDMVQALSTILNFMSRWRREYWERLHWVTMDPALDYQASAELRSISGLADLYQDRKDRGSTFDTKRKEMMAELEKVDGYDAKIWYEPGLWVVPQDPCYWITRDPALNISLPSQLATVDELECARTQWATRRSDNAFLNLAPVELTRQLLNDQERVQNPLVPDPSFAHDDLEDVLAALL